MTNSTVVAAGRDGIGSVKVSDQARMTATESGGTVTTIRIGDLSQPGSGPVICPARLASALFLPHAGGSAAAFSGVLAGG